MRTNIGVPVPPPFGLRSHGYEAKKLRDLHFDALVALTARSVGGLVITCHGSDFEVLRAQERFELVIWSG